MQSLKEDSRTVTTKWYKFYDARIVRERFMEKLISKIRGVIFIIRNLPAMLDVVDNFQNENDGPTVASPPRAYPLQSIAAQTVHVPQLSMQQVSGPGYTFIFHNSTEFGKTISFHVADHAICHTPDPVETQFEEDDNAQSNDSI